MQVDDLQDVELEGADDVPVSDLEAADVTPAGDAPAADAPDADDDGATWEDLSKAISDFGQGKLTDEPAAKPEGEEQKPDAAKDEAGEKDESGQEDRTPARFQITDENGDEYDLELPKGAKITFKADRRDVVVTSMDKLVEYAQQGVALARRSSMWGTERSRLESQVAERDNALVEHEEILMKALFDEDAAEAMREKLQKWADPETRAALRAARAREQDEAQGREANEQQRAEADADLWEEVQTDIHSQLAGYEYLREEDVPEILTAFHASYVQAFERLVPYLQQAAAEKGIEATDRQIAEIADRTARRVLTRTNLKTLMEAQNARYATRLGKPAKDPAREAEREVEQHNTRVQGKLRQRDQNRRIRGGRPPAGAPRETETPDSFDGMLGSMRRMFREAAG